MFDYKKIRASLYIPAIHHNLQRMLISDAPNSPQSLIVCTEDAIGESDVERALKTLQQSLSFMPRSERMLRFIRPRSPDVLRELLAMTGIDRIDGFVIPKADANTLPGYLKVLGNHPAALMPILETAAVFTSEGITEIRELVAHPSIRTRIMALRIGGNDLLRILGLKRLPGVSIYETPIGTLIPQLVMAFKPFGFRLTGVACDDFTNTELLQREVRRDRWMGLTGKTAIHPSQIQAINNEFTALETELEAANTILHMHSKGVFSMQGMMLEPAVHIDWAREVIASETHSHNKEHKLTTPASCANTTKATNEPRLCEPSETVSEYT